MKEQKSILPSSFTKKYKNAKLIEILSDDMNWGMRDLGYSAKGRRELIQINSLLFDYIETLTDDIDFYLEPYDEDLFEMMPPWVSRQGIGFSVDQQLGGLELDVHFFPCDYSDDQRRHLPFAPVHVPVAVIIDYDVIDRLVKQYFPGRQQSAAIPFSPYRVAELEGNFMDDYKYTEKVCRKAVRGGTEIEINNCERFLSFVKNAGFHN